MSKITHEEIHEQIVKMLQEANAKIKGKVPQSVDDLTIRLKKPSWFNVHGERIKNPYWKKAYRTISNSRRPKATAKKTNAPRQERVHTNNNSITITLPSGMSATALIDLIAIIKKSGAKCSL